MTLCALWSTVQYLIVLGILWKLQTSEFVVCFMYQPILNMHALCMIIVLCILYVWDYHTDKTECQEGITNNCSQTCIRNVSLSGISSYECGCYEGYSRNEIHTNLCEGILLSDQKCYKLLIFNALQTSMNALIIRLTIAQKQRCA